MKMKYIRLFLGFIVLFVCVEANAGTEYQTFQHSSGLYVLSHTDLGKSASIQLYFRIGTAYENDSTAGFSFIVSNLMYKKLLAATEGRNLNVNQIIEPEMFGFTFNTEQDKVEFTLQLIKDVVLNFNCTSSEFAALPKDIIEKSDEATSFTHTSLKKLWGNDYRKVSCLSTAWDSTRMNLPAIDNFTKKYFTASNATLCINGAFDRMQTGVLLDRVFPFTGKIQFNPERITHVLEFKPIVNYSHFISGSIDGKEQCGIIFQNPGARYDRRGSYCAYLLNQIIENEKNTDKINASFKPNNYFGTFTLSSEVSEHNYNSSLAMLTKTVGKIQHLDFVIPEKLDKAKDLVINAYRNLALSGPVFFMKEIAYYRFSNDENYILSFTDSLANITTDDMKWYINNYFVNRAGVMYTQAIINSELIADSSQRVYNLDGDFSNLKCVYELNKTDLFGDSNWTNVYRVINWLQINTDAHVQINGFADESEYNRVKDVALQNFIDSIPTFRKAMPDFIKTGYMRPESMRSLKLMKVFYENGIDLKRITGTSMLFTSDSKEKAQENRKCTFTVEKIKPTISLREYHYTVKK